MSAGDRRSGGISCNGVIESGYRRIQLNSDNFTLSSNWSEWYEQTVDIIEGQFPLDGTLIRNGKYYEHPRPKTLAMEKLPPSPAEMHLKKI